ncbi:MAG TPA: DUF86 domain-containing protein [Thermoanaerobaculia bacterium]|nr:DUF86 domain-containing protein [Thermoanaerobaculia bacterium]
MIDIDLLRKKLALIESYVQDLRALGRPSEIQTDLRELRFEAYTLQISIQAALDVAAHIVSGERMGEPRTNRQLFELLVRNGWLPEELAVSLNGMVGFRNIIVHGYEIVDAAIVEEIAHHHLADLLRFVEAIRGRLKSA